MSMLTKAVAPKTKAELIRALQAASFRSVEVFEGDALARLPKGVTVRSTGRVAVLLGI